MEHRSSQPVIHACVLAAGMSTRFGQTKLVQLLQGKPLLQHVLVAAQAACGGLVTLVVGHDAVAVSAASGGLSNSVVVNRDYELGIGTSISAGVHACRDGADAILMVLADQPLVTTEHLNKLISTWTGSADEIVASSFGEVTSPPILFPTNTFAALCDLSGDTGAKSVLSNDEFAVTFVEFPPALLDVDTPEDLQDLNQD
jgi:molybdenum cofactor cytidylyltransferase